MTLINFLAASRIQAAIECLPRTCAEDHNDRYSAGQGEIEMNMQELEARIAKDVNAYIDEIVKARGLDSESTSRIVANIVASHFTAKDAALHVEGMRFSQDVQECMCKCINRSSEQS